MTDSFELVGGQASGPNGTGGVAQVLAVHAALLPIGRNGCILYYAGDQWLEPQDWEAVEIEADPTKDSRFASAMNEISHSRIYDCASQVVSNPGTPMSDLFCCGHAFLGNGNLAIAGGTQHWPPSEEQNDLHHAHWSS